MPEGWRVPWLHIHSWVLWMPLNYNYAIFATMQTYFCPFCAMISFGDSQDLNGQRRWRKPMFRKLWFTLLNIECFSIERKIICLTGFSSTHYWQSVSTIYNSVYCGLERCGPRLNRFNRKTNSFRSATRALWVMHPKLEEEEKNDTLPVNSGQILCI